MRDFQYSRSLRIISTVVLSFFIWTFGGVFEVAYAVKESNQPSAISNQQKQRNITPPGLPLPQVEGKKSEEKFSRAIEEVEKILSDQPSAVSDQQKRLKAKKAEIEAHDIEIRKQFTDTEAKIKDLPEEIKKRHRDFVRHYDDNLRELILNLDEIQKHGAESKEFKDAINRTKAHLEKVKPPKKHQALDPNKLPHRTPEIEQKEPRSTLEEFQRDSDQQSAFSNQQRKPILLAMNGEPTGLLSSPIPNTQSPTPNTTQGRPTFCLRAAIKSH